jgi:hypothetical protein
MYFFDFNQTTKTLQGMYVAEGRNETIPDTAIEVSEEDYFAASYNPNCTFTIDNSGKIIKTVK